MTGQVTGADGAAGADATTEAGAAPAGAADAASGAPGERSLLGLLEDDVVELQAAVEALTVLARHTRESVAAARHAGARRAVEGIPACGLEWAVETLRARVDAMDRRITGHPADQ